ncbi:MAG TPA: Ig-like domain-containing protein, partial [Candidatus Paceibacterota bacterium]|nr:Ig-like domain-containing protein [Candidatus Paceibacterota bacterium]
MKKPIAERLLATLCVISLFFLSVPVASAAPAIWILVPAAFMRAVSSVSTTSAPFPLITKDLSLMSTGSEVVALQQFLINKSLLKVSAPTGFYGPLTESAVRRWQSGHAIHPTGTVGPVTRLSIALSATVPSATAVTGSSAAANSADDGANSAASSTPASDSSAFSVVAGGATAVAVSARHSSAPRTTSSTVSASAPTVASTSPANGATNVAYDRGVIVYFSEAMDSSTINSSSFQVSAGGSAVSGAFVYHPLQKAVVFYPYANFSPNTTVSVSLSTDIKDTSGNALANAYSMSYTTGSSASASSTVSLGT